MTWHDLAQLLTGLGVLLTALSTLRNGRVLKEVHRTTNSLAQRNEQLAGEAGELRGKAQEKANPS